jgi:diguanylate cyclase (GGDEF)-like protein
MARMPERPAGEWCGESPALGHNGLVVVTFRNTMPSPCADVAVPLEGDTALCRRELAGRFRTLRFDPALEPDFVVFLRQSQRRNLVACMVLALVVLLAFAALDLPRLRLVQDPAQEALFYRGVLVPRWTTAVLLAAGTWAVARRRVDRRWVPLVLLLMAVYAIQTFVVNNVFMELGLPHAEGANLLLVMVVFYPCGLTFYEELGVALFMSLLALVLGMLMLQPAHMTGHWIQTVLMLLALVLSATNGYLREHAMREQYLMRRLLDWDVGHDPHTGLANRRMFGERGPAGLLQAQREGVPLAFALIDVDHFKAYNDHYGHQAGDEALRQVARLLAQQARRPLDLAVRMGGEEFGLFAYGDDAASLGERLQQLLDGLRALAIQHAPSPTAPWLTVSVGIAQADGDDTIDTLYQRADTLLYRAKGAGRNRIEVQQSLGRKSD